jgi:tetratricopeptide (TPR) repeat protein
LACEIPEENWREAITRWALLEKRRENLEVAAELWQQAAERQDLFALVELAKYAEHRLRDYEQALAWTERALSFVNSTDFPLYERRRWLPELEHRRLRIQLKLAASWKST